MSGMDIYEYPGETINVSKTWQVRNVALCRSGASANKPFCDGSHTAAGFKSK